MNLHHLEQSQVWIGSTCIMTNVAGAISAVADPETDGLFLSASMPGEAADHVVSLGMLPDLSRLVALHRYDPFWMTPATGTSCASVPEETQFLLIEQRTSPKYLVVVPLVKDPFRCSLRGSPNGCLEVVAETGDPGFESVGIRSRVYCGWRQPV